MRYSKTTFDIESGPTPLARKNFRPALGFAFDNAPNMCGGRRAIRVNLDAHMSYAVPEFEIIDTLAHEATHQLDIDFLRGMGINGWGGLYDFFENEAQMNGSRVQLESLFR